MNGEDAVRQIAEMCGGTINEMGQLPDGSGFATMSMPLPKDHWIYGQKDPVFDAPPMPLKMGVRDEITIRIQPPDSVPFVEAYTREQFSHRLREAAKYAIRAATMKGTEMDFDPDALVQNLIVGMLGYHTDDGLSGCDDWANPPRFRKQ